MSVPDTATQGLLILPHLRIQNANAISSPLTHGFPSMTAFLGLMWALDRKMAAAGIPLVPEKVGVICHAHEEQVQAGFVKTFRLTRNPVDKDGSTAAIVEEGRVHLDITLVFQVDGGQPELPDHALLRSDELQRRNIAWAVRDIVSTMRVAGGTVLPATPAPGLYTTPQLWPWPENEEQSLLKFRKLRRQWLPGFTLVSRQDLLQEQWKVLQAQNASATLLDAWLHLSRFNYRSVMDEKGAVSWSHDRPPGSGWLVPIPVGYAALSAIHDAGTVANARDSSTPFRFVEGMYSIGQWISPHRLRRVRDLLWYADSQPDSGLYRCCNDYIEEEQFPCL